MHNTNRPVGGRVTLFLHRLIRLSSPNLNYIIGAGAMVLFADVILHVIPTTSPDVAVVLCNVCNRIYPWHKICFYIYHSEYIQHYEELHGVNHFQAWLQISSN